MGGRCEWLQAVLQVRVRPNSFVCRPGSLGKKHWPVDLCIDANFPNLVGMEWLIDKEADIVVTAVMLRELGRGANPSVYGGAAARVTEGKMGPDYEWSRLRSEEMREGGFFVKQVLTI